MSILECILHTCVSIKNIANTVQMIGYFRTILILVWALAYQVICLSFFLLHAHLYIAKRDIETGQCGSDVTTTGKKGSKMTGAGNWI
jgi:hypothetical protein